MRTKSKTGYRAFFPAIVFVLLIAGWTPRAGGQVPAPAKEQPQPNAAYADFLGRVQTYVNLHKSIQGSLPGLKSTDLPEMITAHQLALARKIREARPNAKMGALFTPEVRTAFRKAVRSEFQGPHGPGARTTIRQGAPVADVHLHVNESYPDGVPFTTVPPSLLAKLPALPDQVAYRIVGHDLILLDVDANLVVDEIVNIIP